MPLTLVSLLAIVVVFVAAGVAHGDVPRPADIAACNHEAQEAARKGKDSRTASPNTKDQSRAAEARRDAGARATDPQLDGMDAEGAKDPVYQAVYRTCMRKRGF